MENKENFITKLLKVIKDAVIMFLENYFNKEEPDRPSKSEVVKLYKDKPTQFDRWVDWAIDGPAQKRRGKYHTKTGFADGLILHYAAGRSNAVGTMKWGARQGYNFMCIDKNGDLYQGAPLDQWGYHAGRSSMIYKGKRITSVSKILCGVETCNAGMLYGVVNGKKYHLNSKERIESYRGRYHPWWNFSKSGAFRGGSPIPTQNVRFVKEKKDNRKVGAYEKFTPEQEETFIRLALWLLEVNPDSRVEYVLGHDEVSPTRKQDPGGSLSMSMRELRGEILRRHNLKRKKLEAA